MPNYPTHSRWGRVGAVVMAGTVGGAVFALFASPLLAVAGALGAGVAAFVGSIFPDVDHHESIPRQKAVRALRILIGLGVVSLAIISWETLVEFVDVTVVGPSETATAELLSTGVEVPAEFVASAGALAAAFLLAGLANPALGAVTRQHRGWTHSVSVTFLLTAAIAGAVWLLTTGLTVERQVTAVAVVGTFFAGILIHLGLDDEIL